MKPINDHSVVACVKGIVNTNTALVELSKYATFPEDFK